MNEKSELLGQLRINRDAAPAARSPRVRTWLVAGGGVLLLGLAMLWSYGGSDDGVPVRLAVAQSAAPAATAGGSVLDASGYVVARRQATVSAQITGRVVEVLIEEGSRVEEGQVLARLDDSNARAQLELSRAQLRAARARVAEVQAQLDEANRQLQRTLQLAEQGLVSDSARDNAQSAVDTLQAQLHSANRGVQVSERSVDVAQRVVDDHVVTAPFTGVVTVKAAQVGEIVSPLSAGGSFTRTGIGTVVDMTSLEVEVDVSENFIHRVQSEQRAVATLNAYPDWRIPARIVAIVPAADRARATVKVRVALDEQDPRVLPDMGVRVSFLGDGPAAAGEPAASGVHIPLEALQRDGDRDHVYVLRNGTVEKRAVTVSSRHGGRARISAGLEAGERVALGELQNLDDGTRVRVQQ